MSDEPTKLRIAIAYCVRCNFLPRALWTAHELLHTYPDYVAGLELVPAHGGIFEVSVNGDVVFSNQNESRYPEIRELKEAINGFLDADEVATLRKHPAKND